jgi:phosphatidate cytidylyltransferase
MNTAERLWSPAAAFGHPVTVSITLSVAVILFAAPILILILQRFGCLSENTHRELVQRWKSWILISALLIVPILLGAAPVFILGLILSLLCYREYARATGLFREHSIHAVVILGLFLVHFAAADHYYRLFVAALPIVMAVIVGIAVGQDRPEGFLQRVALAALGFILFGSWMGHFSYFANDVNYRPILLWILASIELNDIFAYCWGRALGRKQLCPRTSPGKTRAGAVGAMLCTTPLSAWIGHYVFLGQPVDNPVTLIGIGIGISGMGQVGDLLLSSIKRDLGIKDMGATLPGHGGILDRFDSVLLATPVIFHIINYVQGVGTDQTRNIITNFMGNP